MIGLRSSCSNSGSFFRAVPDPTVSYLPSRPPTSLPFVPHPTLPPLSARALQLQVLKAYDASKSDKVVVMKVFDEKKASMDAKKATAVSISSQTPT